MSSHIDFAKQAPGAVGVRQDHPAAAHLPILDTADGRVDLFSGGRRKIAICGFASSSRHLMPIDDPEWIIGGMNQLYRHIARADYWFDIHSNWQDGNVPGTDHYGWLQQCGIPVFMVEPPADIPTGCRYPVEKLVAHFGVDYSTSSVSFMFQWAIYEIEKEVDRLLALQPVTGTMADVAVERKRLASTFTLGVYGIDLVVGDEYDFQKSCAEHWLGYANALGIHVYLPPQTALLKQRWRYGYQAEPDEGILRISDLGLRQTDLNKRFDRLQAKYNATIAEMQAIDGARQEVQHHLNVIDLRLKGAEIPLHAIED